jgi:DMSO/TMAO reductase YedYZ molybdopterin-dependent catalytic subunit
VATTVRDPAGAHTGLIVRRSDPLNCETSIPRLLGGVVMPTAHFYVRNHFPVPALHPSSWRLQVGGLVARPLALSLPQLLSLPSQSMLATLECAGNGRSLMRPAVAGEQWALGAVSTAEWTGVPLDEVLDRAGVLSKAREVVFTGADGPAHESPDGARFQRSLSLGAARDSSVLLAYAMNGEPLPAEHGYPLRLIVPGWYAVAAVKWLTRIEVIGHAFSGHFQTERYVYEWKRNGRLLTEPVQLQRVRALITRPAAGEVVEARRLTVRGLAWSGVAPIARVEVSMDGGAWQPARMLGDPNRHSWQRWELTIAADRPGSTTVRTRATDRNGRTQPDQPPWNRQGYGNNAVQEVAVWVK